MKFKKIIISFFLLFVYSISFTHSITFHEHGFSVAHQHEGVGIDNSTHTHAHHSHSEEFSSSSAHINHNNHCDEGVFDLITCVLSDLTNHQHNDCEFEHQNYNDSKRLTNKSHVKLLASFIVFSNNSNTYSLELNPLKSQLIIDFQSPLINDNPLRGPPVIC